jgi:hypothetical protein
MSGVPAAAWLTCPRCTAPRTMVNVDGGVLCACGGCEWQIALSTQAPTGTTNAAITAGSTAISVASGGASFISGMLLLIDTSTGAEVVTVVGSATNTSIPVPGGFLKNHGSGATFGQLLTSSALTGVGQAMVPAAPGWGF